MFGGSRKKSDDQDWRLQLDLDDSTEAEVVLHKVRVDPHAEDHHAPSLLGDDVVVTHDNGRIFVYAASKGSLDAARVVLASALPDSHGRACVRASHWDEQLRIWRQIEPPLTYEEEQAMTTAVEAEVERRVANEPSESRTVMAVTGRLIRKQFERQMIGYAQGIGLECEVVEHPHLLSTQIAFTVTGAHNDVAAFARYLKSEAQASSRIDPGLIPYGLP
jgi:hypothetical protein